MSINFVNEIPILKNLNIEEKEQISNILCRQNVKKGTVLFYENEPADAIYMVKKGKVKISKINADGKELLLGIRKPNEIFALVTLFRKTNYPATAEVIEDGEVVVLKNNDLEKLLLNYPQISISIIQIMGERLYRVQSKFRDAALYGKLGSLASNLLYLAQQHGKVENGITKIDIHLTHQDLANYIGAARENVNRMMLMLEKNQIIRMEKGFIYLLDQEQLKEFLR